MDDADREQISNGIVAGRSFADIARSINRSTSTVAREVLRNRKENRYCADCAVKKARVRAQTRKRGKRKIILRPILESYVQEKALLHWSPEQIAARLKHEHPKELHMHVSTETIYAYIYALPKGALKKELIKGLRQKHAYRYDRVFRRLRKTEGLREATIEQRPKSVEQRKIPGHWEGDLVVGTRNGSALGSLVERKTRFLLLVPIARTDAKTVSRAFAKAFLTLPEHVRRSMTYDQGTEMSERHWLSEAAGIDIYLAHPRSPWERGTNENTNGLIRDFFPKSTNFHTVTLKQIQEVQDLLNGRPRKVLHFKTPSEAFNRALR